MCWVCTNKRYMDGPIKCDSLHGIFCILYDDNPNAKWICCSPDWCGPNCEECKWRFKCLTTKPE